MDGKEKATRQQQQPLHFRLFTRLFFFLKKEEEGEEQKNMDIYNTLYYYFLLLLFRAFTRSWVSGVLCAMPIFILSAAFLASFLFPSSSTEIPPDKLLLFLHTNSSLSLSLSRSHLFSIAHFLTFFIFLSAKKYESWFLSS